MRVCVCVRVHGVSQVTAWSCGFSLGGDFMNTQTGELRSFNTETHTQTYTHIPILLETEFIELFCIQSWNKTVIIIIRHSHEALLWAVRPRPLNLQDVLGRNSSREKGETAALRLCKRFSWVRENTNVKLKKKILRVSSGNKMLHLCNPTNTSSTITIILITSENHRHDHHHHWQRHY